MERAEILTAMSELKLYGMKAAFDEIITMAVKRQHEPQRIVGDLLTAEITEKQARSIKYQITIAKLPLAKDIDDFRFDNTPINDTLVRDLAGGNFLAHQRNVVLVGGTGTGKTHLAIAIARACIRDGARGRFFNVIDLVNKLRGYLGKPALSDPLAAYLQSATDALQQKRPKVACDALKAFINAVKANKNLTPAQKTDLTADATRIRAVIGC